jgi:hypothetical protein
VIFFLFEHSSGAGLVLALFLFSFVLSSMHDYRDEGVSLVYTIVP